MHLRHLKFSTFSRGGGRAKHASKLPLWMGPSAIHPVAGLTIGGGVYKWSKFKVKFW